MKSKKNVTYVKKNFVMIKIKKKLKIVVIIQENLEEQLIAFVIKRHKVPQEIPVVFCNGSTCDYHFIIKQLAEEFKG